MLRLTSSDGTVIAALEPAEEQGETFRPTTIMQHVSRALEADPGLTRNAVHSAVKGKAKYIDLALELLAREEYIRVARDGQAKLHYPVKPYRFPPLPIASGEPVRATASPASPPLQGEAGAIPLHDSDVDRADRFLIDHADSNGRQIA